MANDVVVTTWNALEPAARNELAAVVAGGDMDTFHTQYHDAMAWWLLLMLACIGGGVALFLELDVPELLSMLATDPMLTLSGCMRSPPHLALLAVLVIGPWTAITWIRNHKRRGLALTGDAVVIVRGRHLKRVRFADIASVERTQHGRAGRRARPFTGLVLTTQAGGKVSMFTTARWADALAGRLRQAAA